MKDLFEGQGRNFFVTAFVPASGFLLICLAFFTPILPPELRQEMSLDFSNVALNTLLLVFIAVILGLTIYSLNTAIFKLVEGEYFVRRFSFLCRHQRRQASKLKQEITKLKDLLDTPEVDTWPPMKLNKHQVKLYRLKARYASNFPSREEDILPTRFGNILRAAGEYPSAMYGIDTVKMWPRQAMAIPDSHYDKIMESTQSLAFLVNCTLLTMLLAGMSLFVSGYQFLEWRTATGQASAPQLAPASSTTPLPLSASGATITLTVGVQSATVSSAIPIQIMPTVINQPMNPVQDEYKDRAWLYLLLAFLMLILSRVYYFASLPVAGRYGEMMCIAFDLFRFELLKQYRLELPEDSDEEHDTWSKLSEKITLGREVEGLSPFVYCHNFSQPNDGNARRLGPELDDNTV